jgi:group I intron endonuclease
MGSTPIQRLTVNDSAESTVEVALPTLTPEYATGVYCWLNRVNGKRYVGSSARSLLRRLRGRRQSLILGKHNNRYLQRAWNKYGSRAFVFVILERCFPEDCLAREQYWIDEYQSAKYKFGYNLSPTAGSSLGVKFSEETKAKITAKAIGREWTEESKKKLSLTLQGHPVSAKSRAATIKCWTGRKHTPEAKAKMALAAQNRSPETLAKMSASGKLKRLSEEHKKKISLAGIGRKKSPETLARLSASLKGKKRTGQALANIQAANTRRRGGRG